MLQGMDGERVELRLLQAIQTGAVRMTLRFKDVQTDAHTEFWLEPLPWQRFIEDATEVLYDGHGQAKLSGKGREANLSLLSTGQGLLVGGRIDRADGSLQISWSFLSRAGPDTARQLQRMDGIAWMAAPFERDDASRVDMVPGMLVRHVDGPARRRILDLELDHLQFKTGPSGLKSDSFVPDLNDRVTFLLAVDQLEQAIIGESPGPIKAEIDELRSIWRWNDPDGRAAKIRLLRSLLER